MTKHYYIENLAILKDLSALKEHDLDRRGYITDDPTTYEYLIKSNQQPISGSKYLPQSQLDLSADFGGKLTKFWVDGINNYYSGLKIGSAINTNLYNYIASSVFKYQCLMSLKDRGIRADIYSYKKTDLNVAKNLDTDQLLAEISSLKEFGGVFSTIDLVNDNKSSKKGYSVITKFNIKNSLYYILGFLADPTKFNFHLNKKRLRRISINDLKDLDSKKQTLLILSTSPQIQVNFLGWIARGSDVYQCDIPFQNNGNNNQSKQSLLKSYLIENSLDFKASKEYKGLLDFLAKRISEYVSDFILPMHIKIENSIGLINHPKLKIVNGGREIQETLFSNLMSSYKIPTITFQEGTSCMHEFYRHLAPLGYITQGDAFVSRSLHEEKYYKEITGEFAKNFFCYGSKSIQFSKYPKLSRLIGRKLWNINRSENVVLYVPTRFHGKTIRPYKTFTDMQYWDYQKKLAQDVFPVIDKHVYIKKHKKEHMSKVAQLGCIVCKQMGYPDTPCELHHIKEKGKSKMGKKASDYEVIGLCYLHHRGDQGYHHSPKKFTERFGTQKELLQKVLSYVNCCGGCE